MSGDRLVTGDDVCKAVQARLEAGLPEWILTRPDLQLAAVTTWEQLPTPEALQSAAMPVGTITTPGVSQAPTRRGGKVRATWRVAVGVYDRDTSHSATQARARVWAALVRAVVLEDRTLGGLAESLEWAGEAYDASTATTAARTLGGCAVAFDVVVDDVVPTRLPPRPGAAPAPTVIATRAAVTVRTTTPQE